MLAARLQPRAARSSACSWTTRSACSSWISNSPDLTDALWPTSAGGAGTVRRRTGGRCPVARSTGWAAATSAHPDGGAVGGRCGSTWAGSCATGSPAMWPRCADSAERHGIRGVPLMINIHGTEGGTGCRSLSGSASSSSPTPGRVRRRVRSLPRVTCRRPPPTSTSSTPSMAAVNYADQPLTSLEFEAGTGDYGRSGGLLRPVDRRSEDPALSGPGQPDDQLLPLRRRHQPAAGHPGG